VELYYENYFPGPKMEKYDWIRNCFTAQVKGSVLANTDKPFIDLSNSKVSDGDSS
jgi:hypothetical protein